MNRKQNSLMRFSRTERLAQLSEQEIVIEKKKREIQAKIEAQKKKETEEAFRKLEASKEAKTNKPGFTKKSSSWKSGGHQTDQKIGKSTDEDKNESLKNAFSNDGSFLDQFKKLSKSGLVSSEVDAKKSGKGDVKEFQGQSILTDDYTDSREKFINTAQYTNNSSGSSQQFHIPQPGIVKLGPQQPYEMSSRVPSVTENFDPVAPLPDILNSTPIDSKTNLSANEIHSKGIASIPQANSMTTMLGNSKQDDSLLDFSVNPTKLSSVPFSLTPSDKQSPLQMQQKNTPNPIKTETKSHVDGISLTFKSNIAKKLGTSNPFDDEDDDSNDNSDIKGDDLKEKTHQKLSSRISPALSEGRDEGRCRRDVEEDKILRLAELVAKSGDDFEEIMRKRNEDDPSLRFLSDKNSNEYNSFRQLVLKCRRKIKDTNCLSTSDSSDDDDDDETSLRKRRNKRERRHKKEGSGESEKCSRRFKEQSGRSERASPRDCDGEQGDGEKATSYYKMPEAGAEEAFTLGHKQPMSNSSRTPGGSSSTPTESEQSKTEERRKRKRKSRWGDAVASSSNSQPSSLVTNFNLQTGKLPAPKTNLLSQLTRTDPGLIQYARQTFGSTNLSEEDWKKAEDHYKINLLYQDLVKKRAEIDKLERAGKFKYEYDSDEDVEGGTWEHKLRQQEMMATQLWAEELTRQAAGKHHIGDFLPPEELERFMEKYNAVKEGREPDLSDYKEFKLKEDNVGYRLLQKMGWNEGQGLGQDGSGITNPVNKATTRHENQGLGIERPDGLEAGDDEYDAYRKRMMLAYRFRPNPLNNPRRPYY